MTPEDKKAIMKHYRNGLTTHQIGIKLKHLRKQHQLTSKEFKEWIEDVIAGLSYSDFDTKI